MPEVARLKLSHGVRMPRSRVSSRSSYDRERPRWTRVRPPFRDWCSYLDGRGLDWKSVDLEAVAARDALRDALAKADIQLPSLRLDAHSLASEYLPPLVELGRCNPAVARHLAEVLSRCAS